MASASNATGTTKKRKRQEEQESSVQITFATSAASSSQLGPVLASFPSVTPPERTPFKTYATRKPDGEVSEHLHIAGETDTVEFYSTHEAEDSNYGCKYLIGVRNKRTNVITWQPAPLHIMTRRVKALKGPPPETATDLERIAARNALGETFGTKKAVKAIRAAARNKVDVSAMGTVTELLQDSIQTNTETLPTKEEARDAADGSRLVPPYNLQALMPADAYPLHDIVPESELNAAPLAAIFAASSAEERIACLPFARSQWVRQHMKQQFAESKPNRTELKVIYYVSAMLFFRSIVFRLNQKDTKDRKFVQDRMSGVPAAIVDGLLSRFTETSRGSSTIHSTTTTQTKLLTYLFALTLHADNFATDTSLVAHDMSMDVKKVNLLYKSLGCKIEKSRRAEDGADARRAMLYVPLQFPKPKTGAKRK